MGGCVRCVCVGGWLSSSAAACHLCSSFLVTGECAEMNFCFSLAIGYKFECSRSSTRSSCRSAIRTCKHFCYNAYFSCQLVPEINSVLRVVSSTEWEHWKSRIFRNWRIGSLHLRLLADLVISKKNRRQSIRLICLPFISGQLDDKWTFGSLLGFRVSSFSLPVRKDCLSISRDRLFPIGLSITDFNFRQLITSEHDRNIRMFAWISPVSVHAGWVWVTFGLLVKCLPFLFFAFLPQTAFYANAFDYRHSILVSPFLPPGNTLVELAMEVCIVFCIQSRPFLWTVSHFERVLFTFLNVARRACRLTIKPTRTHTRSCSFCLFVYQFEFHRFHQCGCGLRNVFTSFNSKTWPAAFLFLQVDIFSCFSIEKCFVDVTSFSRFALDYRWSSLLLVDFGVSFFYRSFPGCCFSIEDQFFSPGLAFQMFNLVDQLCS